MKLPFSTLGLLLLIMGAPLCLLTHSESQDSISGDAARPAGGPATVHDGTPVTTTSVTGGPSAEMGGMCPEFELQLPDSGGLVKYLVVPTGVCCRPQGEASWDTASWDTASWEAWTHTRASGSAAAVERPGPPIRVSWLLEAGYQAAKNTLREQSERTWVVQGVQLSRNYFTWYAAAFPVCDGRPGSGRRR